MPIEIRMELFRRNSKVQKLITIKSNAIHAYVGGNIGVIQNRLIDLASLIKEVSRKRTESAIAPINGLSAHKVIVQHMSVLTQKSVHCVPYRPSVSCKPGRSSGGAAIETAKEPDVHRIVCLLSAIEVSRTPIRVAGAGIA
jgi:hypothetical protein